MPVMKIRCSLDPPNGFASLDDASSAINAFCDVPPTRHRNNDLKKNLHRRSDGRWYWDPAFVSYADSRPTLITVGSLPSQLRSPYRLKSSAELDLR
jgi:hypothetical protein